MATKSILKTVYIKDNDAAKRLANALENAAQKSSEPVNYKRSVSTASRKEIREMFIEETSR